MAQERTFCLESQYKVTDIPTDISYPRFLCERSSAFADRIALIDGATGETCTFRDFWRNVHRLAGGLYQRGLQKGDRVCIVTPNCVEYPVLYFGVTSIGGVVVPLNPFLTARELLYFFEDAEPSFVISSVNHAETVLKACRHYGDAGKLQEVYFLGNISGYPTYESLLLLGESISTDAEHKELFREWADIDPVRDLLSLSYSSGTTGLQKACMHTHYNFIANAFQMTHPRYSTFGEAEDVTIASVAMYYMFGMLEYFGRAQYQGCTLVVVAGFDLENYLHLVQKYNATILLTTPPVVAAIGHSPLANEHILSTVRRVVNAAAPLREAVVEEFLKKFPKTTIFCGEYGMTEILTCSNGLLVEDFDACCTGLLLPNITIKVVDILTRRCVGPSEDGEICVKSPAIMKGYWKNQEATKAAFDEEGFMLTGDIGRYDTNGRLYVVDRCKDVIKYNGLQVNPSELESIILLHPRVDEVAVVGRPHEISVDLPTAFVVVRRVSQTADEQLQDSALAEEIIDFVDEKVAPWKSLRGGVRFVDSIPKSVSGKVLRRQLRQMLIDEEKKERSLGGKP